MTIPSSADFESSYAGTPPWDIGRPQSAFVGLAQSGGLRGRVLDVGCGTGEHVLMAAGLGLDVTGVDKAASAIAKAIQKAADRKIDARFVEGDALDLSKLDPSKLDPSKLGERYETVLDCGLFHVFDDADRTLFVESLRQVTLPGGRYHMLCFSELQPGDWGPRRVTQDEIRSVFGEGWNVNSIEPSTLEITISPEGARAWLASITRL